jgi:hypothetical protein
MSSLIVLSDAPFFLRFHPGGRLFLHSGDNRRLQALTYTYWGRG